MVLKPIRLWCQPDSPCTRLDCSGLAGTDRHSGKAVPFSVTFRRKARGYRGGAASKASDADPAEQSLAVHTSERGSSARQPRTARGP